MQTAFDGEGGDGIKLKTLRNPVGCDRIPPTGGSKMTTVEIRAILGISRAEFSRRYHIPIRTLENWDAGTRKPPSWALYILERLVRIDGQKMDRKTEEMQ